MTFLRTATGLQRRNRVTSRILLLAATVLFAAAPANAALIPVLISGPTVDVSNFAYNYQVDLLPDESMNPTGTMGVTCPAPNQALAQCNPTGTFVTIYDIPGFVNASVSAPGWGANVQLLGSTPATLIGAMLDDPTLVNVTFFYTGAEVDAFGSEITMTGFQIVSSINGDVKGDFAFQATKDTGMQSGDTDQGDGPVTIPRNATSGIQSTPEPAGMALLGGGLLALGLARRFKRSAPSTKP
jgi:hypothetical protein